MKLKIKEFHFETDTPKLKWWHWIISVLVTLGIIFKEKISEIF